MKGLKKIVRLMLAGLIGLVALAPASAAYAYPPEQEVIPFELSYTYQDQCAFPVESSASLVARRTYFRDQDGNVTRVQTNWVARPTLTNLDTGKRLVGTWAISSSDVFLEGSGTIEATAQGHLTITAPGGGPVLSSAGRIVLLIDASTGAIIEVVFEAGQFNAGYMFPAEDITAVCPYLE